MTQVSASRISRAASALTPSSTSPRSAARRPAAARLPVGLAGRVRLPLLDGPQPVLPDLAPLGAVAVPRVVAAVADGQLAVGPQDQHLDGRVLLDRPAARPGRL